MAARKIYNVASMSSCSSCEPPAPPEGGLVSCASGSLDYIKELRGRMELAGIPAIAAAPAPGRG
jgi:hypothetical protein